MHVLSFLMAYMKKSNSEPRTDNWQMTCWFLLRIEENIFKNPVGFFVSNISQSELIPNMLFNYSNCFVFPYNK